MKTLSKSVGILVLAVFGTLASSAAMADFHGHHHGGNVRFGISLGVPIYGFGYYPPYYPYPAYGYPAYAYPPVVVNSAAPPVYVEQPAAQAAAPAQTQGDWYYCEPAKAYYPYVTECPAGWQRVPAQPPAR